VTNKHYLGGSLESHQTTAFGWPASGHDRLDREGRAGMLAPILYLLIGLSLTLWCLCLGSDCDGPEKSVRGPVDPTVLFRAEPVPTNNGAWRPSEAVCEGAVNLPKARSGLPFIGAICSKRPCFARSHIPRRLARRYNQNLPHSRLGWMGRHLRRDTAVRCALRTAATAPQGTIRRRQPNNYSLELD
jgi:hypothetical protein